MNNPRIVIQVLLLAIFVNLGICQPLAAQTGGDEELYFRRTHQGFFPPAGLDTSDHSGEVGVATNATGPAPTIRPQRAAGVDPNNLGKGDWIWQVSSCISALGVGTVQGLIDYEKNRGMQWITVKCADGGNTNSWAQFNTDLITRAHAAGLKIFGWAYLYGNKFNNLQGEINAALTCLDKGADGFIIDAEIEYEGAGQEAAAEQFCQAIRARYPNVFLAHAPFPIISAHSKYPYVVFGKYCDAVMPQAYWKDIGNTSTFMVSRLDTEWKNWQNSLAAADKDAIKPIIPIGQGYTSVNGAVTNGEVTAFINSLKTNPAPASVGGYKGVSFWSCQHHSATVWNEIGAANMFSTNDPPAIGSQPLSRCVDVGAKVMFIVNAYGANPLSYQWRFNGTNLPGATADTNIIANTQAANAGPYSVVISNAYGAVTSSVARLTVNSPMAAMQLVYQDDFETNSAASWNLFQGSGNGVSDYTATWNYDYSTNIYTKNANLTNGAAVTNLIPAAPNSSGGTPHGLKLTVNKNDATAATAGVSLYPKNQSFSGNHVMRFDLWLNYNGSSGGGVGSTEYATFGINHTGTRVNWGAGTASASDGVWFAVDGEGASGGSDYRAYHGTNGVPVLLSFANSGLAVNGAQSDSASDLFYYSLFSYPTYESPGAPGKHWVQGEISQINNVITWRLNGIVVAQRTNTSSFTSGNIMIGYQDLFTSIANPPGDNFVLFDNVRVYLVGLPPAIVSHPQSQTANGGTNVTFTVSATGDNPLSYQWKVNGSNIAGATIGSITLTNVQADDAGDYSVIVSNSFGTAISSNAVLTLNLPPTITTQPTNRVVNPGGSVLSRVVAVGTAPLSYQWVRAGTNIAGATGSNYGISNVQPGHEGVYWVVVSNDYGSVTSSNFTITVNAPPSIAEQPQAQTVNVGSNASFSVTALGGAPLAYQWLFNGSAIIGATNSVFTRANVQLGDAGNYSVSITNQLGSIVSSNALLTVMPAAQPAHFDMITRLPAGDIRLTITGQAGSSYDLEQSTNLLDWTVITNFTSDGSDSIFMDNSATNTPQMYYRLKLSP